MTFYFLKRADMSHWKHFFYSRFLKIDPALKTSSCGLNIFSQADSEENYQINLRTS